MIEPSRLDLSLQAYHNAAVGLAAELERRAINAELAKRLRIEAKRPWPPLRAPELLTLSSLACCAAAAISAQHVIWPLIASRGCVAGGLQTGNPWPGYLVMVY